MRQILPFSALVSLALGACSSQPDPAAATKRATPDQPPQAQPTPRSSRLPELTAQGLGDLRIGQPVPASGGWSSLGATDEDGCTTSSSPALGGVYAIVEQGKIRRITLGPASTVRLTGGLGVGASEAMVILRYPGLSEELHKYEAPPAKYLTTVDAGPETSGLRFEIGTDGTVSQIHAGQMPALAYVEGCG